MLVKLDSHNHELKSQNGNNYEIIIVKLKSQLWDYTINLTIIKKGKKCQLVYQFKLLCVNYDIVT